MTLNLIPTCHKCGRKGSGVLLDDGGFRCVPRCDPKRLPPWERDLPPRGECGIVNCPWCSRHPWGGREGNGAGKSSRKLRHAQIGGLLKKTPRHYPVGRILLEMFMFY